jgi:ketosteroid isomerase-like protein
MRYMVATLLLIFSLTMWARQPQPKVPSSPEPCAQMRQQFLRAYNANDADAVVALYAEDATLVSDGGSFKGRNEIRVWVKSGLDQGSKLEVIEPDVEKSSGILAYGTGRTKRLVGSVVHLGQYLIVMERIRGEWKIVQHFSLTAGETRAMNAVLPPQAGQEHIGMFYLGN